MTIAVRPAPPITENKHAIPFKLFIPRELEYEPAKAAWAALRALGNVVLADPFAAPGVSTVFPGVFYADDHDYDSLSVVAAALEPALEDYTEEFEDAWIEVWVPDAYEDKTEAGDITDLTQG